ncbi:MAG TPA: YceI family protein [Bacteroidales bacterium]|jgi:polyisoprenoid-binding protein YceI|nr:YceI family protein [Bacteroidales bacterium]
MKTETLTRTKWITDNSFCEYGFSITYLRITRVKGVFREANVTIYTEDDDFLSSSIEVRINAASIDTGDEERDALLRSPDFFDVENFKHIVFISKKIEKTRNEDRFALQGILSIKDVAAPVRLDVENRGSEKDPLGILKTGFAVTGKIMRSDWDLTWNTQLESGGVLVGDEVMINCEIQLMKADTD